MEILPRSGKFPASTAQDLACAPCSVCLTSALAKDFSFPAWALAMSFVLRIATQSRCRVWERTVIPLSPVRVQRAPQVDSPGFEGVGQMSPSQRDASEYSRVIESCDVRCAGLDSESKEQPFYPCMFFLASCLSYTPICFLIHLHAVSDIILRWVVLSPLQSLPCFVTVLTSQELPCAVRFERCDAVY